MKRILVRAGMSPLVGYDPMDVIYNNLIGNNIGNMLFPYSVSRTLMREDVLIDTINPAKKCTKWDIKTINEKYDCLVLPFANAFRASFIGELKKVTKLVKQLKIPCIVVGVGAQAGIDKTIKNKELDIKTFNPTTLTNIFYYDYDKSNKTVSKLVKRLKYPFLIKQINLL